MCLGLILKISCVSLIISPNSDVGEVACDTSMYIFRDNPAIFQSEEAPAFINNKKLLPLFNMFNIPIFCSTDQFRHSDK